MERCSDWIHRQNFGTLNSSSYTFKTTMLKKRQPDANSPQIKFLINPYISMKLKYFWNTCTESVWKHVSLFVTSLKCCICWTPKGKIRTGTYLMTYLTFLDHSWIAQLCSCTGWILTIAPGWKCILLCEKYSTNRGDCLPCIINTCLKKAYTL